MSFSRINSSQVSSQEQYLPTISNEKLSPQRNQSSLVVASSSTQTSCSHEDLINDLKNARKDPTQLAMYECLENSVFNDKAEHSGLISKEEVELEPDLEIEGVSSISREFRPGGKLHSDLSLRKKPPQKCFHERSKIIASSRTTKRTLFGSIVLNSKVYEDRGESLFIFHPADWLVWLGMQTSLDVMISKSTRGWQNNLSSRTFRAVSDDALIFEFCETGNVEGIRTLLARGDASVMDRDPDGWTPLHVSIILLSSCSLSSCQEISCFVRVQCNC
jgi:hypothetical protein